LRFFSIRRSFERSNLSAYIEADLTQKLTICTTCKFSKESAFDRNGKTGGETLRNKLEILRDKRGTRLNIVGHECLWACKHSCAVLLEDEKRTGYLAGYFAPEDNDAQSILDWCEAHDRTEDGNVPFVEWPHGMRGHFIARIPGKDAAKTS
jgi:predicted metal-binding protein